MLWLLVVWFLLSVPFGVLVGRGITAGHVVLSAVEPASARGADVGPSDRERALV